MPIPTNITGQAMIGFTNPPDLFFFGFSPSYLYNVQGITWPMEEAPSFKTLQQDTAGGREVMESLYSNPLHAWKLKWSVLYNDSEFQSNPSTDLELFYSFFCAMTGKFNEFLYQPRESAVVKSPLALPDTNGYVELVYPLGTFFTESVQELNGATPTIYAYNGSSYTDITVDCTFYAAASIAPYDGICFTTTASMSSVVSLAWTGNFFYRCHFDADSYSFEEFLYKLMRTGIGFRQVRI